MRRTCFILPIVAGCMLAGLSARAAYLEEDEATAPVERIIVLPPPPPPPIAPDNPLTKAVRRISVLPGHTYKGLTVFPLETSHVSDRTDYASVDEALREGLLVITEKGTGSVPVLLAENKGDRPILMLAGEILAGGKQNRILKEDVLLPRRSGRVELPVLCVERGRWSGRGSVFSTNPGTAAVNVRAAAQAGMAQERIWSGVSYYQTRLNVTSPTADLQAIQDSDQVREALAGYKEAFRKTCPRRAVGMVVARHGRIVGAEIFCNPAVFRKHRDRLLESYAVDCFAAQKRPNMEEPTRRRPRVDRKDAERFLRRTLRAEYEWRGTPGVGRLLAVHGTGINGLSLVYRKALVHAGLFAQDAVIIQPMPMRRPPGILQREEAD